MVMEKETERWRESQVKEEILEEIQRKEDRNRYGRRQRQTDTDRRTDQQGEQGKGR